MELQEQSQSVNSEELRVNGTAISGNPGNLASPKGSSSAIFQILGNNPASMATLGATRGQGSGYPSETTAWLVATALSKEAAIEGVIVELGETEAQVLVSVGIDDPTARLNDERIIGPALNHSWKTGKAIAGNGEFLGSFQQFLVVPMVDQFHSLPIGYIYVETSCPFSNLWARQDLIESLAQSLSVSFRVESVPADINSTEAMFVEIADDNFDTGQYACSELALSAALEFSRTQDSAEAMTFALEDLSRFHLVTGGYQQADHFLNLALENFQAQPSADAAPTLAETIHLAAKHALEQKDAATAEARLLQAAEVLESLNPNHLGLIRILQDLSDLYSKRGLSDVADAMFERSLEIAA